MTFTNQAAAEMRQRLEERLGRRAASRMTIGTFHAICLALLGDVGLIGQGEALSLAEETLRVLGRKGSARALLQGVSRVKRRVSGDGWTGRGDLAGLLCPAGGAGDAGL